MESKSSPLSTTQRECFIETAKELECDEDEDRFNETLKRIAKAKPGEFESSGSS